MDDGRTTSARRQGDFALAAWARNLGRPHAEPQREQLLARTGGVVAIVALVSYLVWRVTCTLPTAPSEDRTAAFALIAFEALPLIGLVYKAIALWNIDTEAPDPVTTAAPNGARVVVLIPTYNEPPEVIGPTIVGSCALQPAHETWVLDDGDREWVEEMCGTYGARYVTRTNHDHAKAGNLNNALALLAEEDELGIGGADLIAVLDCDHVPLPHFLTATLGWFDDPAIALVQGPQNFYNSRAFDDDGFTGEQGLFFNVVLPSRQHAGVGPFWCGSTSLLRVKALRDVGGVATETITEDLHTTIKLIRQGWKTAYHHQTLAVGLAPATPDQYLTQRRRWGIGAMQILARERLWSAKRWMSWPTFAEYANGTLWWLEGVATVLAFAMPVAILLSGFNVSTAPPLVFAGAFGAMFSARLWGARRLLRKQIHWPTAFALRVFRIPVGLACLRWLISRQQVRFHVTPKGADSDRRRGRPPTSLVVLAVIDAGVLAYAAAGVQGWVPWRTSAPATAASAAWLVLVGLALLAGIRRIRALQYATSRRAAHRVGLDAIVRVDGVEARLADISVGGAAVRFREGTIPDNGHVEIELPGMTPFKMEMVAKRDRGTGSLVGALRVTPHDWSALATMSLWLFHTPVRATDLPDGVPAVASTRFA